MVETILNNTTPYGKIRASHEGSLHSSTLKHAMFTTYAFIFLNSHLECLEMYFKFDRN